MGNVSDSCKFGLNDYSDSSEQRKGIKLSDILVPIFAMGAFTLASPSNMGKNLIYFPIEGSSLNGAIHCNGPVRDGIFLDTGSKLRFMDDALSDSFRDRETRMNIRKRVIYSANMTSCPK